MLKALNDNAVASVDYGLLEDREFVLQQGIQGERPCDNLIRPLIPPDIIMFRYVFIRLIRAAKSVVSNHAAYNNFV